MNESNLEGTKKCCMCKELKPITSFSKDRSRSDGINNRCKTCDSIKNNKWRKENPEKKKRADYLWRQKNLQHCKDTTNKWKKENPARVRELNAKRRAKKKGNTPKFIEDCPIDSERRRFAYILRDCLTEKTGIQHHVDHMWPVFDGGPHWSGNLDVVPAQENLSKSKTVDDEIKKVIKEGMEYARRCYEGQEVC